MYAVHTYFSLCVSLYFGSDLSQGETHTNSLSFVPEMAINAIPGIRNFNNFLGEQASRPLRRVHSFAVNIACLFDLFTACH